MKRRMQPRQLKTLVETGHYKPEPALVAEAMLQHRGVLALLTRKQTAISSAGQTPPAPATGRPQAA